MSVHLHRLVRQDIQQVLERYESEAGRKLADEFYAELISLIHAAVENPGRFHLDRSGLCRANLRRFPYHFLYRERSDGIYVLVVRHHKRHPSVGLERE